MNDERKIPKTYTTTIGLEFSASFTPAFEQFSANQVRSVEPADSRNQAENNGLP